MTTAEMLRREGRAEGRQEGKVQGKREALLLLLRQRFGRLAAAAVAIIDNADASELDGLFIKGITASSLDEVLGASVPARPNKAAPAPHRASARRPRA